MNVAEVSAIAREWVEQYGSRLPGYCAAHLMGSVPALPKTAAFPPYRDVDIAIISSEGKKDDEHNVEVSYRGVIIECGFYGTDEYASAEVLLANPGLAPHLAVDSVLHDPHGLLRAVQPLVAHGYRRRHWVLARCEVEKRDALDLLQKLGHAAATDEYLGVLYPLVAQPLCGLIAVAHLCAPTHRRCLGMTHDLLHQAGRPELHEALLDLLGYTTLTRTQVESWLQPLSTAFDRAVAVKRSPSPYGFKVHAHIRPYFVEGARELIEEGLHREAMWWLVSGFYVCNAVIQNDGDAGEKGYFEDVYRAMLGSLATETPSERQARTLRARRLAGEMFALADKTVAAHPLVIP